MSGQSRQQDLAPSPQKPEKKGPARALVPSETPLKDAGSHQGRLLFQVATNNHAPQSTPAGAPKGPHLPPMAASVANRRPQPLLGPLQPLRDSAWAFSQPPNGPLAFSGPAAGIQPFQGPAPSLPPLLGSPIGPGAINAPSGGLNAAKTLTPGLPPFPPSATGLPSLPPGSLSGTHTFQGSPSGSLTLLGASSGALSHLSSSSRVPVLQNPTSTSPPQNLIAGPPNPLSSQTTFQAQTWLQPPHYQPNVLQHPLHVRSASYPAHSFYPRALQTGSSHISQGQRASSAGLVSRFSLHPQPSQPLQPVNKVNFPVTPLPHLLTVPEHKLALLKNLIYPHIAVRKYSTAAIDPQRNYLVVFEYPVNGHWVIWDYETGYVHLTGIWKASLREAPPATVSASKADIVKLLDSTPKQFHAYIKRIRGGFLKIQGTWLPYNLCRVLARRFCYPIRHELVPIFGVDFPSYCLRPEDPGYGELRLNDVLEDSSVFAAGEMKLSNPTMALESSRKRRRRTNPDPRPILALPTPPLFLELPGIERRGSIPEANRTGASGPAWGPLPGHTMPIEASIQQPLAPNIVTTPILEALLEAIGLFLAPSKPVPRPKRLSHKHLQLLPLNISQRDLTDILNASKCLQSLSGSTLMLMETSHIAVKSPKDENAANYIATSPKQALEKEEKSGISSILLAASVSEQPKPGRSTSLKINDLLS